jgi:hypothetical protein
VARQECCCQGLTETLEPHVHTQARNDAGSVCLAGGAVGEGRILPRSPQRCGAASARKARAGQARKQVLLQRWQPNFSQLPRRKAIAFKHQADAFVLRLAGPVGIGDELVDAFVLRAPFELAQCG